MRGSSEEDLATSVSRALGVLIVAVGVALSPLALDACLITCHTSASSVGATAHHACHTDVPGHPGSRAQSRGHHQDLVVDGIVRIEHAAGASSPVMMGAMLPVRSAWVIVGPGNRATSPPRTDMALQPITASALPQRI